MRLLLKDLAAFLDAGPATAARFAAWDWRGQEALARAVLTGGRRVAPQAIWRALAADLPAPLASACLAVAGDRAEAAALLMGRAEGPEVTLEEVAAVDPKGVLALARRMAPAERTAFFRLIGGQRRLDASPASATPGSARAVLTLVDPTGPSGSFALRRGNALVPLAKLPLGAHGAAVLAWAKGATLERFGPNRSVRAEKVFRIGWQGKIANPRRKIGYDLIGAEILEALPDLGVEAVDEVDPSSL